ncbi:helix-turn-helix domain-containing protein [Celeribacter ethanolicus]|uniref:helix-turn-helix domain-containing protein n=1 Tax=Celeribacter ethanolicus TaxID=1758178 RepID=UPI001FD5EC0F|nr:helix-turn-helix transcriptional regulator [Celeribacter ethanolicus]
MTGDKLQINLKAARARAGLSLAQTSELTGVSKAMLGQIERGESSPTLATLWKIAKGFHLPLTAFLEDMVLTAGSFTPAPARADRTDPEVGMHTVFAFDPRFGSETFIMTLPPGHSHETPSHDSGVVEDVFVIRARWRCSLTEPGPFCTAATGCGLPPTSRMAIATGRARLRSFTTRSIIRAAQWNKTATDPATTGHATAPAHRLCGNTQCFWNMTRYTGTHLLKSKTHR